MPAASRSTILVPYRVRTLGSALNGEANEGSGELRQGIGRQAVWRRSEPIKQCDALTAVGDNATPAAPMEMPLVAQVRSERLNVYLLLDFGFGERVGWARQHRRRDDADSHD
jgi:hypothetical protein